MAFPTTMPPTEEASADGLRHVLVTGASRGIGRSIALAFAEPGTRLHLVARSDLSDVAKEVETQGAEVRTHRFDLGRLEDLDELLDELFTGIDLPAAASVTLVLNAGVAEPFGLVGTVDPAAVRTNLDVNLTAPTLLTHGFVARTEGFGGPRRVVTITSGAAKHAFPGSSSYAVAKAGLDHLLRNLAVEQQGAENPVRCVGYSPGMVDTSMQGAIRSTDEGDFPGKPRFVAAHEEGRLHDPDAVARDLVAVVEQGAYEDGAVVRYPVTEAASTEKRK